jgi:HAD superfamily hydrolase (TIGR01509 family)
MHPELLIFDCDGVLVDSEPIAMRVLLEGIAEAGLTIAAEHGYDRFLGKDLVAITEMVSEEHGIALSHAALEKMRDDLYACFRRELRPVAGIAAALDAIDLPRCVASSSPIERIRLSLELTGLSSSFEPPHVFSASMVARGKPEPDLFLHAAKTMGVDPARCVVIEDSPAGVEAAQRAGMMVFAFTGGGHAAREVHRRALESLGPSLIFDDMWNLPHHLGLSVRMGNVS